jgi:predicted HTH domain antitoxin
MKIQEQMTRAATTEEDITPQPLAKVLERLEHLSAEIAELRREVMAVELLVVTPQGAKEWARVINHALANSDTREQSDVLITLLPPEFRKSVAAEVYRTNSEVTLARAAEIAGVFSWEIADILCDHGVEPEYCQATKVEIEQEIALLGDQQ